MSFSGLEDAVANYTNQINSYKDQYNEYKDQLKEFRQQSQELISQGFEEVGVPLLIEALKSPLAQAGIAKAQSAVTQYFTAKLQPSEDAPVAEDAEAIPEAPEATYNAYTQQSLPMAPRSPWERPPVNEAPTQEDALAMAEQRAPEEITQEMLPEGAGTIEEAGTGLTEEASTMLSTGVQQATEMAGQAVSQVTAQASDLVTGLATQAQGMVEDLASQAQGVVQGAVQGAVEQAQGIAEGLATQAGEALAGVTQTIQQTATGLASKALGALGVSAGAGEGSEIGATVGAEAGAEVAVGAEGGPVGLVIGGLIALGTLLGEEFSRHKTAPPIYNPDAESVPVYQSGLATGA